MSNNWVATTAIQEFARLAVDEWSIELKRLLEEKHLYQNVEASIAAIRQSVVANMNAGNVPQFDAPVRHWEERRLVPGMKLAYENIAVGGGLIQIVSPTLLATNVKLYCVDCGAPEVFSPLWAKDIASECLDHRGAAMPRKDSSQLFTIAFQCQRCSGDPEAFIIRRKYYRLYLEGRSPIEQVQVPKEIPKIEAGYFRDGVIAYQSGRPLAGVLYLRVFLEAFARRQTGHTTRATGDELMDAYSQLIPQEKRSLMPSLKDLYAKLSEVIHAGSEDADVFRQSRDAIHRHFEFRRLFDIDDVTAEKPGQDTPVSSPAPPEPASAT